MIALKLIDFLKDKIAYCVVYFLSNFLVILVIYLTLIINKLDFPLRNALYTFLVSLILFIILLIYEYTKANSFYKQLNNLLSSDDIIENILTLGESRNQEQKLSKAVLVRIFSSYRIKTDEYEEFHKQYIYFINQWVHQMKTPVSIINLILQDQNKEENKELFISLSEENDKISQGLDMMLYNARLQEFNHDFSVEALNLNSLVRKVTNNNKKALIRNSIFPKITGEATEIKSDNKWLSFVINQIVINAIKYTKVAKRAKRTIIFTISEETSKFVLSIEDNGIGIPKEDLGRVFNAFFTGKNGRKTSESTGMGMYLSKQICTELGHELTVEAEEGKGTIFHITFYKEKNIFKF